MGRRIGVALVTLAVAASLITGAAAAGPAGAESRWDRVTHGLDYLHGRQDANGGFGTMANTAWGILGAVATGERMGSNAWTTAGKNPFRFLESNSHEAAATGSDVDNAPVYYARAIMAYVAVEREDRVFIAGTPRVDLLAKLYSYQDLAEDSATEGAFSPSTSSRRFKAVHTTSWAILSMHAISDNGQERFRLAVQWLAGQQRSDGGFPAQPDGTSNVVDTALAIQALKLAGGTPIDPGVLPAARAYLKSAQRADAGFPMTPGGVTDAEATAAAIQAIIALGEKQSDPAWTVGGSTPALALGGLQRANGAVRQNRNSTARPLLTTSWALIALSNRSFTTYPRSTGPAVPAFAFRPRIKTLAPANRTKFTNTRVVLIRATYTDFEPKGTGIHPSACRIYVNNVNRTRAASFGPAGMRLQLKNVPNGTHTWRLQIVDRAGNTRTVQRTFVVNVPTPPPVTPAPTYRPPGGSYTPPTTITPRPSATLFPTPSTTLTPEPYDSATPYPGTGDATITGTPLVSPSPSPSGSPAAGAASGDGGGSAGAYLGGTLLAMLPIGAVAAYVLHRRRADQLGEAPADAVLPAHGSGWEHLVSTLSGKPGGGAAG